MNFKNKKVLITGHTGFKGSWLSIWLNNLGAEVYGISNGVVSNPSHFSVAGVSEIIDDIRIDINDYKALESCLKRVKPDFVFHLAAQALVGESYAHPIETITTNTIGTANLLQALRKVDNNIIAIIITSDKAYENVEWNWGYRENDRIGGKDPYSASKGMAELVINSFFKSFFIQNETNVKIGVTRAGNVIGGGDWADNRIVPDCVKAWSKNQTVDIRNPRSTRPWQHVLEPLGGYIILANKLSESAELNGEAFNFGPLSDQNHTVEQLINEMGKYWENVRWNDTSKENELFYEASLLKLNCDKALSLLGWKSKLNFGDTVEMTINWYKEFYNNPKKSMIDFSVGQIEKYSKLIF